MIKIFKNVVYSETQFCIF